MNQVFINRVLNLKKIKYVGFDMDHTLIRYHTREFEALTHQLMINNLIATRGYPKEIKEIPFNFDWAIRGLVIDAKLGNILKLSRHGAIRTSYHGTRQIEFSEQKKIYRSTYIDLADPSYLPVDTSFSIAFASLYANLVDIKDKLKDRLPDFENIAYDAIEALDICHRDGSLKSMVTNNLDRYVIKDKEIVDGLDKFRKHGKKIFLVTNSDFHYSKKLLDYALAPFCKNQNYFDLFEYVITLSQKPRFFYDNLKFLKIDPANGSMTNCEGSLEPGIYQGGCAKKFTADLNLNDDEILYIGDHIYGDILRLKKDCNWRTALVVEELKEEVAKLADAKDLDKEILKLMDEKKPLEDELLNLTSLRIENSSNEYDTRIKELQRLIDPVDKKIGLAIKKQNDHYNPIWGNVFRTGNEESYFAYQVDRYACIYMAKVTDLLSQSPRSYFRNQRRNLAHEY